MNVFSAHPNIEKTLRSLEKDTQGKTIKLIKVLSVQGKFLSMPFSKKIGKDLYELRVNAGQNFRVLYTFKSDKIILLHAFIKKTNKLPKKELKIAKERLRACNRYNV